MGLETGGDTLVSSTDWTDLNDSEARSVSYF